MSKRILVVEDQADNRQIIRDRDHRGRKRRTNAGGYRKAAARFDPDGYPTADRRRLHGHAQNQGRSRNAIDPDHRGDFLCAQRRGEEGARGGL